MIKKVPFELEEEKDISGEMEEMRNGRSETSKVNYIC